MTDPNSFLAQRDEIKLYMEKAFQASFGYFAALLAFLALSKTSYAADIALAIGAKNSGLLAIVVLLINLFYLILLCSCLYAILKRGLFILCSDHSSVQRRWEVFARDPSDFGVGMNGNLIEWNIDNYFMIPVFLVISLVSIIAAYFGIESGPVYLQVAAAGLAVCHLIPCWMLYSLHKLNGACQRVSHKSSRRD